MIINLLSNPRNISTALMYSFAQREDCSVLDEPFYGRYLEKTGLNHPGREDVLRTQHLLYDDILSHVEKQRSASQHVFIKNMAHHLRDVDNGFFKRCFNLIFIRHPKKVLASFAKVIRQPSLEDIAIKDQFGLAKYFEEEGVPYCILDSSSLIASPEKALKLLCQSIGISFDPAMLSWTVGKKEYDGSWAPHWYARVHQSSSFDPASKRNENPLPESLVPVLEEAMIYYSQLTNRALVVK